jgi:hypothetical protein
VHRTWRVNDHPAWLVFEMEAGLQIRPAQHKVAEHLMGHPGSVVQLNMGEGKTRVILPMLILHWADGTNLVRAVQSLSDVHGNFQVAYKHQRWHGRR